MNIVLSLSIIILVTLTVASGIEMCKGRFELPSVREVKSDPIYDPRNRLKAAKISLKAVCPTRMKVVWWWYDPQKGISKSSGEGDADFRSSSATSGDNHTFKLHVHLLDKNISSIADVAQFLHITFEILYNCNTVRLSFDLSDVIRLLKSTTIIPQTLTELPRRQYILSEDGVYDIKSGLFAGAGSTAESDGRCGYFLLRNGGKLVDMSFEDPSDRIRSESREKDSRSHEIICHVDLTGLEALYVNLGRLVWLGDATRGIQTRLQIMTELRRQGVDRPAILVKGTAQNAFPDSNNGLLIAANGEETKFACYADAVNPPYIAAAWFDGGSPELLESFGNFDSFSPSLAVGMFMVKSPSTLGDSARYVCSAAVEQEVVSQRFRVVRQLKVTIKDHDALARQIVKKTKQYKFTCEATGYPRPELKFFWAPPGRFYTSFASRRFLNENKNKEVDDSDALTTTVRVVGNTTLGTLEVKDSRKVLDIWPAGSEFIACFAYNNFTISTKYVAQDYYYRFRNSTGGN